MELKETEKRLLEAVSKIIEEEGFTQIGINRIAKKAQCDKVLIYRYFGSVEGLMAAYIRQHDFWINFPLEYPSREKLPAFVKSMFQGQIEQLRNNPTLKRLYRWELSCNNDMIVKLREQREKVGIDLVKKVSELTGHPQKEIAAIASILTASITYLVMLEDFCPVYNGIPLNENSGWEQINEGIEVFINKIFQNEH